MCIELDLADNQLSKFDFNLCPRLVFADLSRNRLEMLEMLPPAIRELRLATNFFRRIPQLTAETLEALWRRADDRL